MLRGEQVLRIWGRAGCSLVALRRSAAGSDLVFVGPESHGVIQAPGAPASQPQWSPSGKVVAALVGLDCIAFVRASDGAEMNRCTMPSAVACFAWCDDGSLVARCTEAAMATEWYECGTGISKPSPSVWGGLHADKLTFTECDGSPVAVAFGIQTGVRFARADSPRLWFDVPELRGALVVRLLAAPCRQKCLVGHMAGDGGPHVGPESLAVAGWEEGKLRVTPIASMELAAAAWLDNDLLIVTIAGRGRVDVVSQASSRTLCGEGLHNAQPTADPNMLAGLWRGRIVSVDMQDGTLGPWLSWPSEDQQ